jgi:integrase
MPRRTLTDRFCQLAKPAEGQVQTDYYDATRTGLALRVSGRSKTWNYIYLWGGKRRRLALGTYPATSLAKAHTRVDEAKAVIEDGHDPHALFAKPDTLRDICEEWLGREAAGLRTGEARKATLVNHVYPALGDRPIEDIRRNEIARMLDAIQDTAGPSAADMALAAVRRVFNWYATRNDDFRSPIVRGMARTKPHERARQRILTDDELRLVWRTAEGQGAFGRLVRFLLLTAARRTEAAGMAWAELDGSEWLLPTIRNKTKVDLLRPLPKAALNVIGAKPDGAVFVFSSDGGATALCGYSKLKGYFDKATGPMPNWGLHDLRRTARSLMSRAGVQSDHAERVLGHVIGGVRGVYDRHEYRDEKQDALEKLARQIDRILHPRPTSVTLQRVAPERSV